MAGMSEKKSKKELRAAVPLYIRELFGRPPVLSTEDRDAYDRLLAELVIDIDPRGITEWLWVRDLADLNWDILRMRRAIASLLNISFKPALIEIMLRLLPSYGRDQIARELAEQWFATAEVERVIGRGKVIDTLAKYGLEPDSVVGEAFALRCHELEKMEHMLTSAERRRNAIMRELQVHRESLKISREASNEIMIDAEPTQLLPAE
jgi:hypothetical protein